MTEQMPEVPVLFEDSNVLVVSKPAGLLVHPTDANPEAMSLTKIFAGKLAKSDNLRPGVVHRLDKDTSGVMIMAKTPEALEFLQAQFKDRKVRKSYIALVWGHLEHPQARIELPVARSRKSPNKMTIHTSGREAVTQYKVTADYPDFSLLEVSIMTGRMHQIRVQFAHLGHAVVGDELYSHKSRPSGLSRQFLHAHKLTIALPSGTEREFVAPMAADLQSFLDNA